MTEVLLKSPSSGSGSNILSMQRFQGLTLEPPTRDVSDKYSSTPPPHSSILTMFRFRHLADRRNDLNPPHTQHNATIKRPSGSGNLSYCCAWGPHLDPRSLGLVLFIVFARKHSVGDAFRKRLHFLAVTFSRLFYYLHCC